MQRYVLSVLCEIFRVEKKAANPNKTNPKSFIISTSSSRTYRFGRMITSPTVDSRQNWNSIKSKQIKTAASLTPRTLGQSNTINRAISSICSCPLSLSVLNPSTSSPTCLNFIFQRKIKALYTQKNICN